MRITSRSRVVSGLALIGASAVVLAGCASAPDDDPGASGDSTTPALDFLPCMVSDAGGFDDKSFNQLGYEGLKEAASALGVESKTAESKDETDYDPNITSLIDAGCDLIVTVGFNLSEATIAAATANPDVEFAIIDDAADADFDGAADAPNIKPILFDTAQAAFLAGYAAASYTTTGTLGTWGGMNFPTVAIFSDGFAQGAAYYNSEKGTDVKVVGYDPADPESYTLTNGFAANDEAKQVATNIIGQGADVLLPVGGPIFQSAGAAIEDSGDDSIVMLGVDADLYETYPTYKSLYLTSILKNMAPAVNEVVTAAANDEFDATPYLGTLENGGVGIAPFHDFEDKVSPDLQGELDAISEGIIGGDIEVKSYLAE